LDSWQLAFWNTGTLEQFGIWNLEFGILKYTVMKKLTLLIFVFHFSFFTFHLSEAQVINIPADYPTIQLGVDAANTGDTVLVSDGTYYEQISFLGKKPLIVASQFLMDGDTNHISNTIIDGSLLSDIDNASVVAFKSGEDTTTILCGFTIQGGKGTWDTENNNRCGGGIFISGSGAKIIYNKITANTVDDTQQGNGQESYGGGIGTSHEDADYWIVIEHNQIYNNTVVTKYGWSAGGGIYVSYNVRVDSNLIAENTSTATTDGWGSGGGFSHIDLDGGVANTLIILNNKFHHNTARSINGFGLEGAACTVHGHLIFSDNEVTANLGITPVGQGGGMGGLSIIDPAEGCIVHDNIFRENIGTHDGGAIILENYSGSPNPNLVVISNNYFLDNEGTYGGAVRVYDIPVIFQNNVFHGNMATLNGGAIHMQKLTNYSFVHLVTMINNSFSANSALNSGGAIYSIKAKPLIFNSVFFNNLANISGPEIYSNYPSDTVIITFCNIDTSLIYGNGYVDDAGGNINADPGFLDDSCHIDQFSACVDKAADSVNLDGTWYYAPMTDFDGDSRPDPVNHIMDIGSDEFYDIPGAPTAIDPLELECDYFIAAWNQTTWAQAYWLDMAFDENFNSIVPGYLNLNMGTDTSFRVDNLDAGLFYYYRVRASNGSGVSPNSNTVTVDICVNINEQNIQSSQITVRSYPNPTGGITHFAFHNSQYQCISLKVYDVQGRQVAEVLNERMPAGEHIISYDISVLPSGIYYYRLKTVDYRLTAGKLVKY
jgi:predicted outer membrane repeat protein